MTTQRTCAQCGTPEIRTRDRRGRESTNLSPLTGTCTDCVIALSREMRGLPTAERLPFDARAAAANDRSDA